MKHQLFFLPIQSRKCDNDSRIEGGGKDAENQPKQDKGKIACGSDHHKCKGQ